MTRLEEFLTECRSAVSEPLPGAGCTLRRIGNDPDICRQILALILSGQKTGTFSLPQELEREGTVPSPGDYVVLTDADGKPACLIRIERCEVKPFNEIGPAELEIEGPGARDQATWRAIHQAYWTPLLESRGERFREDLPVLVQRFTRLYPAADAAPA